MRCVSACCRRGGGGGGGVRGEMSKHEFFVDMTCEGCSNAVTRVLNKLEDVQFDIDLPNKKVFIESSRSVEDLTHFLKKTGKEVQYIGKK